MTIEIKPANAQAEGTALPPPRAFGDGNTLTLLLDGRAGVSTASVHGFSGPQTLPHEHVTVSAVVLPVALHALTVTF